MKFENQVRLIVGASSGLGRVVALELASAGARLVVTARRKDKLDQLLAALAQHRVRTFGNHGYPSAGMS